MSRCECCDTSLEHSVKTIIAHWDNVPYDSLLSRSEIIDELREALERLDEERGDRIIPRSGVIG
jgi:hypothetical protein